MGLRRAEIKPGVREIHLCKDERGKTGLQLKNVDQVRGLGRRGAGYGMARRGMARHSTAWRGTAWHRVVWCTMVWHGVVWHHTALESPT